MLFHGYHENVIGKGSLFVDNLDNKLGEVKNKEQVKLLLMKFISILQPSSESTS